MRYMVEYARISAVPAHRTVACAFTQPIADATVRGGDTANDNFGSGESLFTQRAVGDVPESKIYIKMPIPQERAGHSARVHAAVPAADLGRRRG